MYNSNRATAPDSSYTYGSFKDESAPGTEDGTPLQKDWQNQHEAPLQCALVQSGWVPSGVVDSVQRSQVFGAQRTVFGMGTLPQSAGIDALCAGLPYRHWALPDESPNYIDISQTVVSSCLGWFWYYQKPLVYYAYGTTIEALYGLWDYTPGSLQVSAIPITYPSTPSHILSLCSDGDNLYVCWRRDSDGNIMVSKVLQNPSNASTPTWTVDTGESYPDDDDLYYFDLIVADAGNLALSMADLSVTITGQGVAIINKSTGAVTKGHGNNTSYSIPDNKPLYGRIVSDGSHVFWLGRQGSDPSTFYLASANISDPTMSSYSLATLASSVDASTDRGRFVTSLLNIGGTSGTVAFMDAKGRIGIFAKSSGRVGGCVHLSNHSEYDPNPDGYGVMIGSDGLNAWPVLFENQIRGVDPTIPAMALYKIPLASLATRRVQPSLSVWEETKPLAIGIDNGDIDADFRLGNIIFDTLNMIVITRTGKVYRIPNPGGR